MMTVSYIESWGMGIRDRSIWSSFLRLIREGRNLWPSRIEIRSITGKKILWNEAERRTTMRKRLQRVLGLMFFLLVQEASTTTTTSFCVFGKSPRRTRCHNQKHCSPFPIRPKNDIRSSSSSSSLSFSEPHASSSSPPREGGQQEEGEEGWSHHISSALQQVLDKYDGLSRCITLDMTQAPYWAEIYHNGQAETALIQDVLFPSTPSPQQQQQQQEPAKEQEELEWVLREPKVRVTFVSSSSSSTAVIDLGQITTLWSLGGGDPNPLDSLTGSLPVQANANAIPRAHVERLLDRLHATTVRKGRRQQQQQQQQQQPTTTTSKQQQQQQPQPPLAKKRIQAEAQAVASSILSQPQFHTTLQQQQHQQHALVASFVEQVLRKVQKTGIGYARLIDCTTVATLLSSSSSSIPTHAAPNKATEPHRTKTPTPPQRLAHDRAVASVVLARDAAQGGRFKRWPVVLLGQNASAGTLTLLNGGWVVQDQSVRADLEAQKLVHGTREPDRDKTTTTTIVVASERRILRRLECLAMGGGGSGDKDDDDASMDRRLQLDVKRALAALNLPRTPAGARQALVELGHWSHTEQYASVAPWPPEVLEAALHYARHDQAVLAAASRRVDLSNLPCICVDAKGTAFRDDALGIRLRRQQHGSSGSKSASSAKWEVLVHIADVSDIYATPTTTPSNHNLSESLQSRLALLRQAAETRGQSRYDLPLGPLHLMPPVALKALSLSSTKHHDKKNHNNNNNKENTKQPCVTLWASIDPNDGTLLDAGIERTLVAPPVELTYESASILMNNDDNKAEEKNRERLTLLALERVLLQWYKKRQERSQTAQKREARLRHRQQETRDPAMPHDMYQDDESFQRTRAHRLVDAALELYSYCARRLLNRAKAPIPFVPGAGRAEGGRVATAPLRRYIDGQSQRQLLAVVAGYGKPLTKEECRRVVEIANDSRKATVSTKRVATTPRNRPSDTRTNTKGRRG